MWSVPEFSGTLPTGRAAHSCEIVGGYMFIIGGWDGRKALIDIFCLDISANHWYEAPAIQDSPTPRNNQASASSEGMIYLHGGHDGASWLSDLHILDVSSSLSGGESGIASRLGKVSWREVSTGGKAPCSRACHTLTRVGRKLYMFGGYNGSRCFNEMDVFDIDTHTWIQPLVSGCVPIARNAHSTTAIGKSLYMFGGHSGSRHLNDLHVFNTIRMEWSQIDACGSIPTGLRGHSASLVSGKIFVFGGYNGKERSSSLNVFDVESKTWLESLKSGDSVIPGRQRHIAVFLSLRRLLIFGGFDGKRWLSDFHSFDVSQFHDNRTNQNALNALKDLSSLVNNPQSFPDVYFVMDDGTKVAAHKGILAARSEHFRAMFCLNMSESKTFEISMKNCTATVFTTMLHFLYTGSFRDLQTINQTAELLQLSDHLTIDDLKKCCEIELTNAADIQNICDLVLIADKFNAHTLRKFCLSFILDNFNTIANQPSFERLSTDPSLLIEITKAVARQKLHN